MQATRESRPRERFAARVPFDPSYPDALAVHCSDGRFTEAVEELLRCRGHARLDTVTLPGGPALLDSWTASWSAHEAMTRALAFLVEKHGIRHVALVGHAGCGFYKERFPFETGEELRARQERDLRVAARLVRQAHRVQVELYWAEPVNGRLVFERVPEERQDDKL